MVNNELHDHFTRQSHFLHTRRDAIMYINSFYSHSVVGKRARLVNFDRAG